MKRITLFLLLFIPFAAFSQSKRGTAEFLDVKPGFKDIMLKDNFSKIKSMVELTPANISSRLSLNGKVCYTVTDEQVLAIDDYTRVDNIYVATFENKATYIIIMTDGAVGEKLFYAFQESFGRPNFHYRGNLEDCMWLTKKTALQVTIKDNIGTFIFLDRDLNKKSKSSAEVSDDI